MQKGDKARVINDCEVKAGSEVEVIGFSRSRTERQFVMGEDLKLTGECRETEANFFDCYFNNIRVEISESNLEAIKTEEGENNNRWLPDECETYWFPSLGLKKSTQLVWYNDFQDFETRNSVGVYRTKEESDAMLAKIQALVTSEIGEA